jgi:PTS system cellobiose-specific IIC component
VLIGHLLWFAGIHGAAIVSGMLQMFWLTNLGMNQQALAQGAPLPHIFMEAFWTFFIVIGGLAPQWAWSSATCAAGRRICVQSVD